jgi:predicted O-methyltransferase YrrM
MDTLQYILNKFKIKLDRRTAMPIDLVDFNRSHFTQLLAELEFKKGVEVGVADGLFSEMLCNALPDGHIWSVDPWIVYGKHRKEQHYRDEKECKRFYQAASDRLTALPNCTMIQEFSMAAVKHFDDESLDFVYIDADHLLKSVVDDVVEWSEKVKIGGIVAGHDYTAPIPLIHVRAAVTAYTTAYKIWPFFSFGRLRSTEDKKRDRARSWMWVKEPRKWA